MHFLSAENTFFDKMDTRLSDGKVFHKHHQGIFVGNI